MDEAQFDELYEVSFSRLTGQLYAMIGDREEAQDCVQEAFIRAWDHRASLQKRGHPEAWVRTTAYRLAVSRWRRIVKGRRAPDRALQPAMTQGPPSADHVALVGALGKLPEDQRRAIVLHHLCDLSVGDVAAEVGAPAGTVKARLSRGRAALAEILGDAGDTAVLNSAAHADPTVDSATGWGADDILGRQHPRGYSHE